MFNNSFNTCFVMEASVLKSASKKVEKFFQYLNLFIYNQQTIFG